MRVDQLDRPITFVHIPKTAGTSVTTYLANHFDSTHISTTFFGDYNSIPVDVKFRSGHFRYRQVAELGPSHFITFLRHPIERAVSQYKSWHDPSKLDVSWLDDPAVEHVRWTQQATLDEFLLSDHPHIRASFENVQTSLLSHYLPGHWQFLTSALRALESEFCFVGIVERFPDSIELLRATFKGLREYQLPTEVENRSRYGALVPSQAAAQRVLELNWADMALYNTALGRFDELLAKARSTFYLLAG